MRRRTRIVATLGPSTDRPGVLEALLEAGLDVVRINLSHGSPEEHQGRVRRVRDIAKKAGVPVAVLADLPGPKLRAVIPAPLTLTQGQEVTCAAAASVAADLHVTEPEPIHDLQPGHRVLLDDGRMQLRTLRRDGDRLMLSVEAGGTLLPKKGVNLPDTPLSIPAITQRDREAVAVAAKAGADWLALSFVRDPAAADQLRAIAKEYRCDAPVLAKIERPEAVNRAAEIIAAFDGIMVARGDLGVELSLERVPHIQKQLIAQARVAGKPVITATDMLDSMRTSPRPTRAEASDVANAIYDGTDALMLSGETAVGDYPVEAVACMDRIATEAEAQLADLDRDVFVPRGDFDDHLTHLTCALAREVKADAIVTPTNSGRTAKLVARHRPRAAIVPASPRETVLRQLALVWGVRPVPLSPHLSVGEDRLFAAVRSGFEHGALTEGNLVVLLAGHPIEGGALFPTIRLVEVGEGGRCVGLHLG